MIPVETPTAIPVDDPHGSVPQRYLSLLADVAERLLSAGSPAAMVDELFALIRRELRLDIFFNYRLENDRLVLEAHGGMTAAEARDGAELRLGQAVCGCVARDRRPIHATDVQSSDDPLHAFVKNLGLDAYVCTPLLHGDRLLGTLGFGRRWANCFTADEISFLHTVCHYVALAKYRLQTEAELRDGVEARERLLAELNHRVRNALQVAVGLVAVELADADEDARAPLARAVDRLQVLALAHRPLYAGETPDAIDLGKLLTGVVEGRGDGVALGRIHAAPPVPVEMATALALLIHTLLDGRKADDPVAIAIAVDAGRLHVTFANLAPRDDRQGAAARMKTALLRQLRGTIAVGTEGTTLSIPLDHR